MKKILAVLIIGAVGFGIMSMMGVLPVQPTQPAQVSRVQTTIDGTPKKELGTLPSSGSKPSLNFCSETRNSNGSYTRTWCSVKKKFLGGYKVVGEIHQETGRCTGVQSSFDYYTQIEKDKNGPCD